MEKGLASWYIVFSANQLVLITGKATKEALCRLRDNSPSEQDEGEFEEIIARVYGSQDFSGSPSAPGEAASSMAWPINPH